MNVQKGDVAVIIRGIGKSNANYGMVVTVGDFAPKGTEVILCGGESIGVTGAPSWWCSSEDPFNIPAGENGSEPLVAHHGALPIPDVVLKRISPPQTQKDTQKEDELCTQ